MVNKFNFSVNNRLPKLYITAAKILKAVKTEGKSFKNTVYAYANPSGRDRVVQGSAGLVGKVLQHSVELDRMYKFIESKKKGEAYLDEHKVLILITELVWRKGYLPKRDHDIIKILNEYQDDLRAMATTTINEGNSEVALPRYARINVLMTTENLVLTHLTNEGWIEKDGGTSYSTYLKHLTKLKKPYFMKDFHYPEIIAFPPQTRLYNHPLCLQNAIILQAKSTCVAVKLLNPRPGSVVLDMCAAPGMKTSQLAAHMNDIGVIHAFERDPGRHATLQQILKQTGVTCAKTYNNDALSIEPHFFSDVTHILVDPSCSGSGMNRVEMTSKTEEQIENLAKFQYLILCKAMSFPSVRRIVYSTCSVYEKENEAVVSDALAFHNNNFKLVDAWPDTTKGQFTRGSSSYPGGELTSYILPEKDLSTGFFVAVIERVSKKKEKRKNREEGNEDTSMDVNQLVPGKKKKKKHETQDYNVTLGSLEETDQDIHTEIREKKKRDSIEVDSTQDIEIEDTDHSETKSKKKRSNEDAHIASEIHIDTNTDQNNLGDVKEKKKKRKRKSENENGIEEGKAPNQLSEVCDQKKKKKKKKKKHNSKNNSQGRIGTKKASKLTK